MAQPPRQRVFSDLHHYNQLRHGRSPRPLSQDAAVAALSRGISQPKTQCRKWRALDFLVVALLLSQAST